MFGISFPETCLIILIAFLILGPQKIQGFAFNLGKYLGKIKQEFKHFKETRLTDLDDSTFYDAKTEMNKGLGELKDKEQ